MHILLILDDSLPLIIRRKKGKQNYEYIIIYWLITEIHFLFTHPFRFLLHIHFNQLQL